MSSAGCRVLLRSPHTIGLRSWLTRRSIPLLPLPYCRNASNSQRHLPAWTRNLQTSATRRNDDGPSAEQNTAKALADKAAAVVLASQHPETEIYLGPLTQTFRRLKLFSLASLGLTTVMAPFLFFMETASAVPLVGRVALVGTVLVTSSVSTMLVGWLGMPYVTVLRWFPAEGSSTENGKRAVGVEMTTMTLTLKERITHVYDSAFLVPTNRPLAKWELAEVFKLPEKEVDVLAKECGLPREETIAETMDKDGRVLGRWIVKWEADGTGTCRQTGKIIRYFNIHEDLIGKNVRESYTHPPHTD